MFGVHGVASTAVLEPVLDAASFARIKIPDCLCAAERAGSVSLTVPTARV